MLFDQNQTPMFKIRHCTVQDCNVRSLSTMNNKIEKNQVTNGERAQMSEVFKGMQAQIIWPIGVRCRDFPAWSFASAQTKSAASCGCRAVVRLCAKKLLTLAKSTISTKIAATGMLELTVTLRADAYHVRHDRTGDRCLYLRLGLVLTNRAG